MTDGQARSPQCVRLNPGPVLGSENTAVSKTNRNPCLNGCFQRKTAKRKEVSQSVRGTVAKAGEGRGGHRLPLALAAWCVPPPPSVAFRREILSAGPCGRQTPSHRASWLPERDLKDRVAHSGFTKKIESRSYDSLERDQTRARPPSSDGCSFLCRRCWDVTSFHVGSLTLRNSVTFTDMSASRIYDQKCVHL